MQKKPIVIAHRGASGYRPEHTLAAYELAIEMGADFIEPDLVITKDGILIARHENEISETTDVAVRPEFLSRKALKIIDGEAKIGWFTEDFTLAEIKTIRAKERIPQLRPQNTKFDGILEIPTLQEVIDLVKRKSIETGRIIGIYPETKHPTYFQLIGLSLEDILIETLQANGYEGNNAPIFIQSFEVTNLKYLSTKTDLPLVQLLNLNAKPYDFIVNSDTQTYIDLVKIEELKKISSYAQAIGIHKNLLVPRDDNGKLLSPTSLVSDAHAANLLIHAWTFRNEDCFLPQDLQGNPQGEYELFFNLGIDGVFSDYPDTAISVYLSMK
ncbi:glycerophosphodiester phosphodiesterase [Chlorogloeopsis sp. ULAP01]|uniref:glycerophosphodiester phosphodiesterase n=1 Tax=Chlorogloeopsis sp. ULAP01 TaxID=3056483 RepID=UPI0025AACA75|nr:glycerophosphodiester phosphodiesterase [Chlorogloeopsis sp. ULAP01]MDM9380595.1 glycerophosphodiester phosphodiesterase [Chlorogloeopsis sp. ULAP01]